MNAASYTELALRDQRIIAKVAARARLDTIFGGCAALTLVKRMPRADRALGLSGIVSDVYSQSTGRHHSDYEAWECPECGQARLGKAEAMQCCQEEEQ